MKHIIALLALVFFSTSAFADIQQKRDSAADWITNNPTLAAGVIGVEEDTNRIKIGNGSTAWNSLPYVGVAIVASGATAMSGNSVAANTCSTAVAVSAAGVATTDTIIATPDAILSTVAGYGVTSAGALRIDVYPTANNVNFQLCNPTDTAIDPDAITINWKVIR